MKNLIFITFGLFFIGCSQVKNLFDHGKLDTTDVSIKDILHKFNAENKNQTLLYFTTGFKNDTIVLQNGKEILFDLPIETIDQLGLSIIEKIDNRFDVNITVKLQKPIKIRLNKIKNYKFIYISRIINRKFLVEYSNLKRDFY